MVSGQQVWADMSSQTGAWLATLPDVVLFLIKNDLPYIQQRVFILRIFMLLWQAKSPGPNVSSHSDRKYPESRKKGPVAKLLTSGQATVGRTVQWIISAPLGRICVAVKATLQA